MARDRIENRYTIEYINPDHSDERSGGSGWLFKLGVLALLALGLVFSIFFPFESLQKYFPNSVDKKVEIVEKAPVIVTPPITEAVVEKENINVTEKKVIEEPKPKKPEKIIISEPVIDELVKKASTETLSVENKKLLEELNQLNSKIQAEQAQTVAMKKALEERKATMEKVDISNAALTEKLDQLMSQLQAEKNKNKALAEKVNVTDGKNIKLSQLLDNALKTASTADKNYIDAIDSYEETKTEEKKVSESSDAVIVNPKEVVIAEVSESTEYDYNNAVSLETVSQVDAIIAAMQQGGDTAASAPKAKSKPVDSKVITEVVTATSNMEDSTNDVPLYLDLQQQINRLIENKDSQFTNYKKVLNDESDVRSNAVRSIVVQKGETLWSIAKRAYGNGSFFKKIIEANPQITKDGKIVLKEGQVIRVPI